MKFFQRTDSEGKTKDFHDGFAAGVAEATHRVAHEFMLAQEEVRGKAIARAKMEAVEVPTADPRKPLKLPVTCPDTHDPLDDIRAAQRSQGLVP